MEQVSTAACGVPVPELVDVPEETMAHEDCTLEQRKRVRWKGHQRENTVY